MTIPQNLTPKIYGLIGYPVKHSLSSLMNNAAFQHYKIVARYLLFEVEPERLEGFLLDDIVVNDTQGNSVRVKDVLGFNITIPHKVRTKEILEKKFPFEIKDKDGPWAEYYVKYSGAINTVKRDGDKLQYYNTDATGFLRALKKDLGFDVCGKNVLVIGCGGAGRAIIAALSWKNQARKIYINDVSEAAINSAKEHFFSGVPQASFLKDKLEFIARQQISDSIKDCHLLVNATPIGMKESDPPVIDKNLLHKELSVYDVIYNRETPLIRDARSLGLASRDGKGMLLYQGADSFYIWTGKDAPVEVMREALEKGIGNAG